MILLQTQTGDGETVETLWKGETVRIHVWLLPDNSVQCLTSDQHFFRLLETMQSFVRTSNMKCYC